ncbi:MAG: hypothetical protein HYY16_14955 [Planctomycetes bacterium]|nr:hypothetical protein [Planctomycetota bacterium]
MLPFILLLLAGQPQEPPVMLGWGIEPRASAWRPDLNGRFNADQATGLGPMIDGTTLKLDADLDIDDEDTFGYYELGFTEVLRRGEQQVTLDRLTLSFWTHQWTGDATLDDPELFDGVLFGAGETVDTEFRVWSFGLDGVPVVAETNIENGAVITGLTIGFRVIDVQVELSAPGRDPDERTRLFYVGAGFRSEWKPSPNVFLAASGGLYFSLGSLHDDWEWVFENWAGVAAEGALSFGIDVSHLRLEAGLRFASNAFEIERERSDSREDNDFSYFAGGPFLQAGIRW